MNRKDFLHSALAGTGIAVSAFEAACQKQPSTKAPAPTAPSKGEKLVERVFADTIAAATVGAAFAGDALGLFKAMTGKGPMEARQLAGSTGLNERYLLEWLSAMAAAGYLDYHADTQLFELPAEHSAVLSDSNSPLFAAGILQGVVPEIWMIPKLLAAIRTGKGIPYSEYPPETFQSIARSSRPDFLHLLTQQWLPAIPGLMDRLKAGCAAADLGSGDGFASIMLARTFPQVRAFGYEPYAPSVARASRDAEQAGLAGRVKFSTFDGVTVPGGPYGLITMNYALHHAGDPARLLTSAGRALDKDGVMMIVDFHRSERLEQDIQTPRQMSYLFGLLECLPTALAEGGPGYGTGIKESEMRRLSKVAGFRDCATVLKDDPFRIIFALRK